jgi:putative aldouronate transport system permease protein
MCLLGLIALCIIFPILKVIGDSVDGQAAVLEFRIWPKEFTLEAYRWLLTLNWLTQPFIISVITTVGGTAIAMTLTTTFAYTLTKKEIPGRKVMMYMAMFTMIFSGGLIPTFLVVKNIGIYNTLWAVILPHAVSTYYLILLKNFFMSIPSSITESAELEGCTPFQIYYRIILPLSKAGLAAISLFYIVNYWNDFFSYVIYINDAKLFNFQYTMRRLILESETQSGWNYNISWNTLKSAIVVVGIIPVVIVYPLLQKYFVQGVQLGALKE